jgi:hypothetical protein
MKKHLSTMFRTLFIVLAIAMLAFAPLASADEGFDETRLLIEINATDGDAGFHALFDAGAWKEVRMDDPYGQKIFDEKAFAGLRAQGLTENFFESAEPVCDEDDAEEDDPVVSLAEFIERFPSGIYNFYGKTNENEHFAGDAELTYDLPAAPVISDGEAFVEDDDVVITWAAGTTLGEKCHDQDLVDDGIISDPALVAIVGWEVVIEPADDEGIDPLRKFTAQLPPGFTSVTISAEFIEAYLDEDIDEFKFEVGAIEASGNQTFSEAEFCIVEEEEDECEGED